MNVDRVFPHSVLSHSYMYRLRDTVQHFRVLQDGTSKYFLYMVRFSSLNELVQHYRTSFISRLQGICLTDPKDEVGRTNHL